MADFLTRLASRTLGLAAMATPVSVPMFAPEPLPQTVIDSDELLNASRPAAERAAAQRAAPLPPGLPPKDLVLPSEAQASRAPTEMRPAPPDIAEPMPRAMAIAPGEAIDRTLPERGPRPSAAGGVADQDAPLMPAVASPPRRLFDEATTQVAALPPATRLPSATPSAITGAKAAVPWPASPARPDALDPVARSAFATRRTAPASWEEPDEALLLPPSPDAVSPIRRDAPEAGAAGRATVTPIDRIQAPRRAEAGQPAVSASAPAAPPTIEITIGRVEVRAVQPPASAARPKPAAPAGPRLSLEDYLRNQHGGRR